MLDLFSAAIITAIALLGFAFIIDSGEIYGVKPGWEDWLFTGIFGVALLGMWVAVIARALA